jgi:hypothetical protein
MSAQIIPFPVRQVTPKPSTPQASLRGVPALTLRLVAAMELPIADPKSDARRPVARLRAKRSAGTFGVLGQRTDP